MILGPLTLSNFSAYAGTQSIDLTPAQDDKPIILIGGLNGSGKTSLLTAVCLALFGKRTVQFTNSGTNYTGMLKDLIHDKSKKHSSVDLTFYTYTIGVRDSFRVCRSWRIKSTGQIVEELEVWKNCHTDGVLSASWDDFIDSLLPASIAHLFFFDGEKVADMANAAGASSLLRTGIYSLLGVNLITRLQDDLADLIGLKAKGHTGDDFETRLSVLDADISELQRQRQEHLSKSTILSATFQEQRETLFQIEEKYREAGAQLFEERHSIEQDELEAESTLTALHDELVEIASGVLPIALVPSLITDVKYQVKLELEAQHAQDLLQIIIDRDQQLLELIGDADHSIVSRAKKFFETDQVNRASVAKSDIFINMGRSTREVLHGINSTINAERDRAMEAIDRYTKAASNLAAIKRRLNMIPAEESVTEIIKLREAQLTLISNTEKELSAVARKIEQCDQAQTFRNTERDRILRLLSKVESEDTVDKRVMRYAQKARERVSRFSELVLRNAMEHLESLILECIQSLFRKEGFICGVTISPDTFVLLLKDHADQLLPLDRLSAGERQLVIVAIIWGLGRASGRPLPLIIDSPLGRLDSTHRENLLANYFPTASHQTILLATDTEITRNDVQHFEQYLGKKFLLSHDDNTRLTHIGEGYFWS